MSMNRNKYLILSVLLAVLAVTWLVLGKDEGVTVTGIATVTDPQSESIAENLVKSSTDGITDSALDSKSATKDTGKQQSNLDSEMDADYKAYILDPTTPITESHRGLIELSNKGNGDALFNLLIAAETCRLYKTDEYCPGTGLDEMGGTPAAFYAILREAASQDSLMAMSMLGMYAPSPFKDAQDLQQNTFLRALMAEVVAEHNSAVREYLDIAAQRGFIFALLKSAEYYAFSPAVDPDREKAAFYILAWQELVTIDNPAMTIPANLQAGILDPMSADAYARVQARAENFAARFKP